MFNHMTFACYNESARSGGSMLRRGGHRPPNLVQPPIFNRCYSNFT